MQFHGMKSSSNAADRQSVYDNQSVAVTLVSFPPSLLNAMVAQTGGLERSGLVCRQGVPDDVLAPSAVRGKNEDRLCEPARAWTS
jgi:hypothetical protein